MPLISRNPNLGLPGAINAVQNAPEGQSIGRTLLDWWKAYTPAGRIYNFIGGFIHPANSGTAAPPAQSPLLPPGTTVSDRPYGPPASDAPPGVQTSGGTPAAPLLAASPADLYNSLRTPFRATWDQLAFPGSAIGPFQGASVPYDLTPRAQAGLGTPNTVDPGLPSWAGVLMNAIRSRNIA